MPDEAAVLAALAKVQDPDLGRDIVSLGFIRDVAISGGAVSFTMELTTPDCPLKDQLKAEAEKAAGSVPGVSAVTVKVTFRVRKSQAQSELLPGVRNVIAVASGKGGVGKSTVAVNLALAFAKSGAKTGLVDLDVYGPSVPGIMGVAGAPAEEDGKIVPIVAHGVKVMSMAFFVPPGEATVWRGPMLHSVVQQFLGQVVWGELDYLIADLPPGTGDVQLSLCHLIKPTGAVIVSTPQDAALSVARKAITMFEKLDTPILGVIENMSGFVCPHCGHREEIFGAGGAKAAAEQSGLKFLGEIPIDTFLRESSDRGMPVVVSAADSPSAKAFFGIAKNLAALVSVRNMCMPEPAAAKGTK
jgi:ATP-binding protein involved in chromosome partitioning